MQFLSQNKRNNKIFMCTDIEYCLSTGNGNCLNMIQFTELHQITVMFKELDEKLNEVSLHECTTEDIHKHLENMVTYIYNQRKHAYLQTPSSQTPSKFLVMYNQFLLSFI